MKKHDIKYCFRLIKQGFIALLNFSESLATKCISLQNEPCIARPTITDLKSYEHNQGLRHYPFMVSLDVTEVVMLLMIHQVEYVLRMKQKM